MANKDNKPQRSVFRSIGSGLNSLYGLIGGWAEEWVEKASKGKFELIAEWFLRRLERQYSQHGNPLLRGDLFEYAKAAYPQRQYPTAWTDMPDDIRRPLIWDGKLLNGADVAELVKAEVKERDIARTFVLAGRRAVVVSILLIVALFWPLSEYYGDLFSYAESRAFGGYDGSLLEYPQWAEDAGAWGPIISWYALDFIASCWSAFVTVLVFVVPIILLIPVIWTFAFAGATQNLWDGLAAPLRAATRDSRMFWKANTMFRQLQYTAYCRQVDDANNYLKDKPVIAVGRAMGVSRSRGDNEAPVEDQIVCFDGESLRQHTMILGGTGEGKTRMVIKPLVKGVVEADWKDHKMGAYITDGKGNLWQDLQHLFAHRKSDIRILGTDQGHQGLDLMAGMTPLQVSTTFATINKQLGDAGTDNYWPKAAALLLMNVAMVAQALDMHEKTRNEWIDEKNFRPYSILALSHIAASEPEMRDCIAKVHEIVREVRSEGKPSPEFEAVLEDAMDAADYLEDAFLESLAKETRGSIVSHITNTIGFFKGHRGLSDRFCRGTYTDVVDVDYALQGGIIMVAIGPTKHGVVGHIVANWLKTRLYTLANRRLIDDPAACESTSCMMVADEFQLLAVAGDDECSDTQFWSTSRQTGLFLISASQSLAALKQKMGETGMAAFVNLMRSKIVMKVEEIASLEYVMKISGQANRGQEYEVGFYATQALREKALGNVGRKRFGLSLRNGFLPQKFSASTFPGDAFNRQYPLERDRKTFDADRAIMFRKEDKEREAMMGVTHGSKFDFDELLVGKNLAWAMIQRAGCDRTDIIDLDFERAA
ncbi:TraM recognition domain-containing protein [Ensifer aridi]|uniref:TraM recognition domain-containing protein n=1 Tax=Ensifer aridi TaxID=1708715 RepID=UPI000A11F6C6|nr:TraM recognition domain-containing protein [Ensifer aridi]